MVNKIPIARKPSEKDLSDFLGEVFERDLDLQRQDLQQEGAYYNEMEAPVPRDRDGKPLVEGLRPVRSGLHRLNIDDLAGMFLQDQPHLEIREPGVTPQKLAEDASDAEKALNELLWQMRRQHEDPWPKLCRDIWPYNRIVSQVIYIPVFWADHPILKDDQAADDYLRDVRHYRRRSSIAPAGSAYRLPIIWRYVYPGHFFQSPDPWGGGECAEIQQETVRALLSRYGHLSKLRSWIATNELKERDHITFVRYENNAYRCYAVMRGAPYSSQADDSWNLTDMAKEPDIEILQVDAHPYGMPSYIYSETTTGHPDSAKNYQGPMTDLPHLQMQIDAILTQQKSIVSTSAWPYIFHQNGRPNLDEQGKPRPPKVLKQLQVEELTEPEEKYIFQSMPGVMSEIDILLQNFRGIWDRKALAPAAVGRPGANIETGYLYAQARAAALVPSSAKAIALQQHYEKVGQMIEKVIQHDIMHDDPKAPGLAVYAGTKESEPKWIELDMGYLRNYHAMSAVIKIHMPTDRAAMWDLVMRTTNAPKPALSRQSALQELANYSDPLTEEKLIGQEELRMALRPVQMEMTKALYQMKLDQTLGTPSPAEQQTMANMAEAGQNGTVPMAGVRGAPNVIAQNQPPTGRPPGGTGGGQPLGVTRRPGGPRRGAGGGRQLPVTVGG